MNLFGVLSAWFALAAVLSTCSDTIVNKEPSKEPDKQPASLKITATNKGSAVVIIKVSLLDEDGELVAKGAYASSELKIKHRCGDSEMIIDQQYATNGVAQIIFHRAAADCTISVAYNNIGESLEVAKLAGEEPPAAQPTTLGLIDASGKAVAATTMFTRIGIRAVGAHLVYPDKPDGLNLEGMPVTVKLMCDYDNDTTYEKQLCLGRKPLNSSGVVTAVLEGDANNTWDSNSDGHHDGNEACFAGVFNEKCQLVAIAPIIIGGKGNITKLQEFEFKQLTLELKKDVAKNDLPSDIKRGLTFLHTETDKTLQSIHVFPQEGGEDFTASELEAFRPLTSNDNITFSRATTHNLYVRIGVESCRDGASPAKVVDYHDVDYANPRLPAADYDSQKVLNKQGKIYALLFDNHTHPGGWYHLAWDRLFQYAQTALINKHGAGVMPTGSGCDGKCLEGSVGSRTATVNCTCSTGVPACLIDPDGVDFSSTPKVYANCHTDTAIYVCRAATQDTSYTCEDESTPTSPSSLDYFDDIYKQTANCTILAEMSRGEIEGNGQLPVCSDDPVFKDSCYTDDDPRSPYDYLPPNPTVHNMVHRFCQAELCANPIATGSNAEKHLHARTCQLAKSTNTPTFTAPGSWAGDAADTKAEWKKCLELLAIRKRIDSWHKTPAWAKDKTITSAPKTIPIID
ncbi:MAG: hypothetical protein OYH77_03695 [Pseudomonadota bacterium]|nr:hypothetical protein [Pseudomonadota bacterium]